MDVIWTAEFAAQGWLKDVSPAIQARANEFIPSTLKTAQIGGKYWAVPFNTNAGLLFYNKGKIHTPPTTWQAAYQMAKSDGGIGYQGQRYEGLTVDYLECSTAPAAAFSRPTVRGRRSTRRRPSRCCRSCRRD